MGKGVPKILQQDSMDAEHAKSRLTRLHRDKKYTFQDKALSKAAIKKRWFAAKYRVRKLSDRQRKAIGLMTDFAHDYTFKYIAQECGVTINCLWKWRQDSLFLSELDKEITRKRGMFRKEAMGQLFRKVRRGSYGRATRDYLKMTGDLKEQSEITIAAQLPKEALENEIKQLTSELESTEVVESES